MLRVGGAAAFLVLSSTGGAAAQEGGWVVIVATVAGDDRAEALATATTETGRLRARGHEVFDEREVTQRLRERLSLPFQPASAEVRDRFIAAVEPALIDVARGARQESLHRIDPRFVESQAGAEAPA